MAGGLIAGKEGPFIHSGGIVGGGWAGMGSLSITKWLNGKAFKVPRKYGGFFRNEADHRDYVCIGTAAGASPLPSFPPWASVQDKKILGGSVCQHWEWIRPTSFDDCLPYFQIRNQTPSLLVATSVVNKTRLVLSVPQSYN